MTQDVAVSSSSSAPVGPHPIPHGKTARRVEWIHLPPRVRSHIEQRIGAGITDAESQTAGFTPGFASVLTDENGGRTFVKAASTKAQRVFAAAYQEEARKLAALPEQAPAASLLWTSEVEDWVVLGIEYLDSRPPARPWTDTDLDATLDALEQIADLLTPPPDRLALAELSEDLADFPAMWPSLREAPQYLPDLDPPFADHVTEAEALAAAYAEVVRGDTLVHTDVRDDNVLVRADGTVAFCDWNWPCRGAAWVDTVLALIGPRGDGLDVEQILRQRRLTRDVPAESIDTVLALVTGYFLRQAQEPVPTSSPHIRDHQRWQGKVCWDWLAHRRGW